MMPPLNKRIKQTASATEIRKRRRFEEKTAKEADRSANEADIAAKEAERADNEAYRRRIADLETEVAQQKDELTAIIAQVNLSYHKMQCLV
jgi:hypothetical protein